MLEAEAIKVNAPDEAWPRRPILLPIEDADDAFDTTDDRAAADDRFVLEKKLLSKYVQKLNRPH